MDEILSLLKSSVQYQKHQTRFHWAKKCKKEVMHMEVNRDVTRRDILYGVLKRVDEVIDSISNTVSTKDFLVRDIIYDLDRLEEAKLALVAVLEDMQQEEKSTMH